MDVDFDYLDINLEELGDICILAGDGTDGNVNEEESSNLPLQQHSGPSSGWLTDPWAHMIANANGSASEGDEKATCSNISANNSTNNGSVAFADGARAAPLAAVPVEEEEHSAEEEEDHGQFGQQVSSQFLTPTKSTRVSNLKLPPTASFDSPVFAEAWSRLKPAYSCSLPDGSIVQPAQDLRACGEIVWADLDFATVSSDERKALVNHAMFLLGRQDGYIKWTVDQHRMSKATGQKQNQLITSTRITCQRAGAPAPTKLVSERHKKGPCNCNCRVKATMYWETGRWKFDRDASTGMPIEHVLECRNTRWTYERYRSDASIYLAQLSPDKRADLERTANDMAQNDPLVSKRTICKQLESKATKFAGDTSSATTLLGTTSSIAGTSSGTTSSIAGTSSDTSLRLAPAPAPGALIERMAVQALEAAQGCVCHQAALGELLSKLREMKCPSDILHDANNPAVASAVTFADPTLSPSEGVPFAVLTADVTCHTINAKDGFARGVSSVCSITPARSIQMLAATALNHEDIPTFHFELSFVLKLYPHLSQRRILFIVDGDQARLWVIRNLFPLATIMLCVYHSTNNMIKHFGKSAPIADATTEREVLCYRLHCGTCNKVRAIPAEWVDRSNPAAMGRLMHITCSDVPGVSSCADPEQEEVTLLCNEPAVAEKIAGEISGGKHTALLYHTSISVPRTAAEQELAQMLGEWPRIWTWLRKSPSMPVVRDRLDAVKEFYPMRSSTGSTHYTDFLWNNRSTWATCLQTWHLSYGLSATSLQEGLHATWKAPLANTRTLRLFELPGHVRETMRNRVINTERASSKSLKELEGSALQQGFSTLVRNLLLTITPEGRQLAFEHLAAAAKYTVRALSSCAVDTLMHDCKHRGTSALRFRVYLSTQRATEIVAPSVSAGSVGGTSSSTTSTIKYVGRFFQVFDGGTGLKDIVHVRPDGGICGTNAAMHQNGFPDCTALAVFRAGELRINPVLHWTSVYYLPAVAELPLDQKLALSCGPDHLLGDTEPLKVTGECSFEHALQLTEERWIQYCHTGDEGLLLNDDNSRAQHPPLPPPTAVAHGSNAPPPGSVSSAFASKATQRERLQKTYRELEPILLSNPTAMEGYLRMYNETMCARAKEAVKAVEDRASVLNITRNYGPYGPSATGSASSRTTGAAGSAVPATVTKNPSNEHKKRIKPALEKQQGSTKRKKSTA